MVISQPLIVLDTNIALYYLGGRLTTPLPSGLYHASIITEMELLSYPNLSKVVSCTSLEPDWKILPAFNAYKGQFDLR